MKYTAYNSCHLVTQVQESTHTHAPPTHRHACTVTWFKDDTVQGLWHYLNVTFPQAERRKDEFLSSEREVQLRVEQESRSSRRHSFFKLLMYPVLTRFLFSQSPKVDHLMTTHHSQHLGPSAWSEIVSYNGPLSWTHKIHSQMHLLDFTNVI